METFRILEDQDLAALSSPFRRQLLDELRDGPDSASNIARRHDMSRQRVGYHMRELVKAGYLEPAGEKQQRGLKEQFYRVRSFAYVHANRAVLSQKAAEDRFSWLSLLNLLARSLWELISLRRLADAQEKQIATLGIEAEVRFASPADRKAFTEALMASVDSLVSEYQAEEGRSFRLLVGACPASQSGREEDERTRH